MGSPGTGPGGNNWYIPPFNAGSSNIWPGSRYGGNTTTPTGGGSGSTPGGGFNFGLINNPPVHGMVEDSPGLRGAQGGAFDRFSTGGSDNGLNLAGTWASSGFGQQQGPASGFNFFNPNANPSDNNFSPVPVGQPFPGLGIGSVGVPGANPNMPFGGGPGGTGNFASGTGMPGLPGVDVKSLEKIYGKGIGAALAQFLSSGAGFNPAVIQAQWNAAQPIKQQTLSKMQTMFGNQGAAYSSTAAIGYGDFSAQFDAALQGEFAQEYQQSVQNYLNVLMGVKGDARDQKAQEPDWISIASQIASSIIPFFA